MVLHFFKLYSATMSVPNEAVDESTLLVLWFCIGDILLSPNSFLPQGNRRGRQSQYPRVFPIPCLTLAAGIERLSPSVLRILSSLLRQAAVRKESEMAAL